MHNMLTCGKKLELAWWLKRRLVTEEAGRAEFNVAKPTYATVAYNVQWFINKTHLKLLQEGFSVEPQRIFSLNIFLHKILGILNFFICICKITCKPIGKFAENLNLGKCVLPLPPAGWGLLWDTLVSPGIANGRNGFPAIISGDSEVY